MPERAADQRAARRTARGVQVLQRSVRVSDRSALGPDPGVLHGLPALQEGVAGSTEVCGAEGGLQVLQRRDSISLRVVTTQEAGAQPCRLDETGMVLEAAAANDPPWPRMSPAAESDLGRATAFW